MDIFILSLTVIIIGLSYIMLGLGSSIYFLIVIFVIFLFARKGSYNV